MARRAGTDEIGSGTFAKTYNMYVQSSPSSPTNRITSAVVDGGALAQQIPNQANQVKFSFDPAGNITYSPFLFSAPTKQVGGAGTDRLVGGTGGDRLVGDAGDDRLAGGAGADRLLDGAGADTYHVDDAGDRVVEAVGDGSDRVYSSASWSMLPTRRSSICAPMASAIWASPLAAMSSTTT